ncbi:GAF domain-containing protein [Mucilaginibacter lacusdianchii]|uniref:GAF domain-containing protein n=1 Tax=Mucilaginibacter lacusdianchii TaxID=2684211 RepID=UPI00131C8C31|nr:GAF domain-containing protein [Mucilaginibacter sp. JXJ CY 39]
MPLQELRRLQAINRFLKLEISKEQELNSILKLAAEICGTPTSLITILDDELAHFKYKLGSSLHVVDSEIAFCSYAVRDDNVMEVPDTVLDERFMHNPLVTNENSVRFYAGAPLTTHDGQKIGTLCVLDQQPKQLSHHQKQMLQVLARQVIHIMEFELSLNVLKEQFIEAKKSEIKLRSFFESSQSSHVLMGQDMAVLAYNKVFDDFIRNLYGIDVEIGIKATDYIDRLYIHDFVSNFNLALTGKTIQHERQLRFSDQMAIWCQITYNPSYDNDGNIIGISFNVNDVTERKKHEQQIIEQNTVLRQIAHFQSHELRKPVASILGLMEVVRLDGYGHNEESLTMMEEAVKELDGVIRNIVDSTEPMAGDEGLALSYS